MSQKSWFYHISPQVYFALTQLVSEMCHKIHVIAKFKKSGLQGYITKSKQQPSVQDRYKVTWINSISVRSSYRWSQDGYFADSNILAVVGMDCPERRITQSYFRNLNVTRPH